MKGPEELTLFDVAANVDCVRVEPEEATDAMNLLREAFEDEGLQYEDKFDKASALVFIRCLPMHLSIYNVTLRAIQRAIEDLKEVSDQAYDAYGVQRVKAKEAAV